MLKLIILLVVSISMVSCSEQAEQADTTSDSEANQQMNAGEKEPAQTETQDPQHITVQHILIAFDGSIRGQKVGRTKAEAQQLAMEVYALAQQGDDFTALIRKYSSDPIRPGDPSPGTYKMSNFGVEPYQGEFARKQMVPAFGDVGFELEVGGVGLAPYDQQKSPYGWHIIKRLE